MDLDFSNLLAKRKWATQRKDHFAKLLDKKLHIIAETLLENPQDDKVAGLLTIALLNILPAKVVFSLFFNDLINAGTPSEEEAEISRFADFLSAINALCYSLRIGRCAPRILVLVSPWRIPCGHIHILDLEPQELCLLLAEARQIHDTNTFRQDVRKIFKAMNPDIENLPSESRPNNPAVTKVWEDFKQILKQSLHLAKTSEEKINECMNGLEQYDSRIAEISAALNDRISTLCPEFSKYQSEFRQSFGKLDNDTALAFFQQSDLKKKAHNTNDSQFRALFRKEWAAYSRVSTSRAKSTPEGVLSAYKKNLDKAREIKKYTVMHNQSEAYRKYCSSVSAPVESDIFSQAYSGITNSHISVLITAKELDIGNAACENHLKTARTHNKINRIWAERVMQSINKPK